MLCAHCNNPSDKQILCTPCLIKYWKSANFNKLGKWSEKK